MPLIEFSSRKAIPDFIKTPLDGAFYAQDAVSLAHQLIGKVLVHETEQGLYLSRIIETEAYYGEDDTACHASKGRTPRTEVMFQSGGLAYIYLIYGMYDMLNIVTGEADHPQAVLIRAVEPLVLSGDALNEGKSESEKESIGESISESEGNEANVLLVPVKVPPKAKRRTNGPGKLCRYLAINRQLNGWDLTQGKQLWIISPFDSPMPIDTGPRIGIDYAESKDRERPWRFWLKDNPYVSR